MNTKIKAALILGLLVVTMAASLCIQTVSAAANGDCDQTQDKTKDQTHDRIQDQDCTLDCLKQQDQSRIKLQTRECC